MPISNMRIDDTSTWPRGIRSNNPGNLRGLPTFKGASRARDGFLIFDTEVNGVRAAAMTLHTYYFGHGLRRVSDIISRWAPNQENPTEAYIEFVGNAMGMTHQQMYADDVHLDHAWQAVKMLTGIFHYENGLPCPEWHSWPDWYCVNTFVRALLVTDLWRDVG